MKRKCYKCKEEKVITLFGRDKYKKSGYGFRCKECGAKYSKKWYVSPSATEKRIERHTKTITQHKKYRQSQKGKVVSIRKAKRMRELYPEKWSARAKVRYAVKTGRLKKLPCDDCGDPKSQGHHPDYNKPLEVIWLCDRHHKELHNLLRMK